MLRVVVLGYGKLAQAVVLGVLRSRHKLVGVMRWEKERPDKFRAFLRDTFNPDGLTSIIRSKGIPEISAKFANSDRFKEQVKKLNPDVIIVASWGEILRQDVIDLPKVACVNCHPSMLPAHRGSNPYVSVLREGETSSGVSFHLIDKDIDTGDILLQEEIQVSIEDNAESLKQKCAVSAKFLTPQLLDGLEMGEIIPVKQNHIEASYFPAIEEDDVIINWNDSAEFIHNQIRAFSPKTGCYTQYNNDFLFIRSSRIVDLKEHVNTPGTIIKKNKKEILISTGDPSKAIQAGNLSIYGFMSKLWSGFYIDKNLKEKTYFE